MGYLENSWLHLRLTGSTINFDVSPQRKCLYFAIAAFVEIELTEVDRASYCEVDRTSYWAIISIYCSLKEDGGKLLGSPEGAEFLFTYL